MDNSNKLQSKQNQTEILYLEVDINQSEKRFRQYAKDYNKELQDPKFIKEQYQLHKEHKVQSQPTIKSLSIKSNHISTVIAIIKAYYHHLKLIERGKLLRNHRFMMNNPAIASMTGMSGRSSQRHVNKLLATGFLQEKIFRGTNAAFVLKINPEFLVARPKKKLNDLLLSQHIERYPGLPINPITYKHYMSLRPSFTDFPLGLIKTVCPHIEINPDTYNNNILSIGIVDNSQNPKRKHPQKISVINNESKIPANAGNPDNKNPEQTNVRQMEVENQSYHRKIQHEPQKNLPPALLSSIFLLTDLAWNFVRSLLYDNRDFQPEQEQTAKYYIAEYFIDYAQNNNPRTLRQGYNEFITTIQIIHDYTRRNIEWQIARPEYLFDPRFKGGFYRAFKDWLPKHKQKQKQNKQWNSNKKLVAQLYRYYTTDPTYESYRKCTQRLGKLKNKKFLDIFNSCVLDNDNYNNQFLNQRN